MAMGMRRNRSSQMANRPKTRRTRTRPPGNKNYTNRNNCNNHNDCYHDEYCDDHGYCFDCHMYLPYCDSYNGQCASHCEQFDPWWENDVNMCDQCTSNQGGCFPDEITDCNGNCAPQDWLGDELCDDGSYTWEGHPINFNCAQFNFDQGDCLEGNGCNTHSNCANHEYCDGNNQCIYCGEFIYECQYGNGTYNGQCPTHCAQYSDYCMGDCPQCPFIPCPDEPLGPHSGDINLDGTLNIMDIVMMTQYVLGNTYINWEQELAGDVHPNGYIDLLDIIQAIDMMLSRGTISNTQAQQLKATLRQGRRNGGLQSPKIRGGAPPEMQWRHPRKRSRKRRLPTRDPRRGRDNR